MIITSVNGLDEEAMVIVDLFPGRTYPALTVLMLLNVTVIPSAALVNVLLLPVLRLLLVVLNLTLFLTVTVQLALLLPTLAVITAVPRATAVTLPEPLTVATLVLEDDHTTELESDDGETDAVSVSVLPTLIVVVDLFKVMVTALTVADAEFSAYRYGFSALQRCGALTARDTVPEPA